MSSSKTLAPPDDALLTALAVEQIATQKRDQTTTAQDVKRDVAKQRETSKPNDENADADVNSRQTSTSDRRDKRDSASRWKTAALAWFGSFAIFCAVATLTFALTRDAYVRADSRRVADANRRDANGCVNRPRLRRSANRAADSDAKRGTASDCVRRTVV